MPPTKPAYYYECNGASAGPVPAADLPTQGVRRDTLVWAAGMDGWQPAGQVAALAPWFAAVPPPLPAAPSGPPPLPMSSVSAGVTSPVPAPLASPPLTPASAFASDGYSLPLLGKFKDDHAVWLLGEAQPFGEFALNQDLQDLQNDGLEAFKTYQFLLLDAVGKPLLTLHKTKPSLLLLRLGEMHVFNAHQQLLGTCHYTGYQSLRRFVTVKDVAGRELLTVKPAALGSRDWVLTTPTQQVVARVRRSQPASWKHLLVEYKHDRLEVIFEPGTRELHKVLGLSAVLTTYVMMPR